VEQISELNVGGNPAMDWHPIQKGGEGGVEIFLDASCYRNQERLWPDGPLSLYADLTHSKCYPINLLPTAFKMLSVYCESKSLRCAKYISPPLRKRICCFIKPEKEVKSYEAAEDCSWFQ